jgi:hypothetical protein
MGLIVTVSMNNTQYAVILYSIFIVQESVIKLIGIIRSAWMSMYKMSLYRVSLWLAWLVTFLPYFSGQLKIYLYGKSLPEWSTFHSPTVLIVSWPYGWVLE